MKYVVAFGLLLQLQSITQPVTLGWNRNPAAEGVTGYRLYVDGRSPVNIGNPPDHPSCGCPTYTVHLPFGNHVMYITAVNARGESAPSGSISASIGDTRASTPFGLRILQGSTSEGDLTFFQTDVGRAGMPGVSSASGSQFLLSSAGLDTWGAADSFHFVYTNQANDGEVIARVNRLDDTDTYAKAGIMWRETLAANSRAVQINVRPDGALEFMERSITGENVRWLSSTDQAPLPLWLRLVRSGNTITGYVSTTGEQWAVVGSTETQMSPEAKVGVFTLSHAPGIAANAMFDNVRVK